MWNNLFNVFCWYLFFILLHYNCAWSLEWIRGTLLQFEREFAIHNASSRFIWIYFCIRNIFWIVLRCFFFENLLTLHKQINGKLETPVKIFAVEHLSFKWGDSNKCHWFQFRAKVNHNLDVLKPAVLLNEWFVSIFACLRFGFSTTKDVTFEKGKYLPAQTSPLKGSFHCRFVCKINN